jgi:hypothetical protein
VRYEIKILLTQLFFDVSIHRQRHFDSISRQTQKCKAKLRAALNYFHPLFLFFLSLPRRYIQHAAAQLAARRYNSVSFAWRER